MANEKRLIDANALSEKIGNMKFEITNNRGGYKYCNEDEKNEWDKLDSFDSLVCDAPTVDAVEVVHAQWDNNGICTLCGYPIPTDSKHDFIDGDDCLFCYHCGAKMDGDGNG